jgi:PAS domain S-box-containing protein
MVNILIVEDEIIVAKDMQVKLEKLGYTVIDIISTGEEAITHTEKTHPDIVLMDIRLEGKMDGIQAAETIRNQYDIPVIFITAYGDEDTFTRAKISEPFGFILKPFEIRELHSNIEIALYKHNVEKELTKHRNNLEQLVEERTKELKETNTKLQREIIQREKAENDAIRAKNSLENVINSASEIIIAIDNRYHVTLWNNTAELLTGYAQKEIIKKTLSKLDVFDNTEELLVHLEKIFRGKTTQLNELILNTIYDEKKYFKLSYSTVRNEAKKAIGVLIIGKDITSMRELQERLQTGGSYLILEKDDAQALNFFEDLAKIKQNGLIITRSTPDTIRNITTTDELELILLSQHDFTGFHTISTLKEITTTITEFIQKHEESVVLLHGVHYLLTQFSFKDFINMIYDIRETISTQNSLFFLHIDPILVDEQQKAIIKHEIKILPEIQESSIIISEESFDILKYVYEKNKKNALVTIKDISRTFTIVYRTTSKRLDSLKNKGLIMIKKYGRSKEIHVTEKGKKLIKKRTPPT